MSDYPSQIIRGYDLTMPPHVEIEHHGSSLGQGTQKVRLNGLECDEWLPPRGLCYKDGKGVRRMYVSGALGKAIKIESQYGQQSKNEHYIWLGLEDEDRSFFTPVYESGTILPPEGGWPTDAETNGKKYPLTTGLSYIITEWYPDMASSKFATREHKDHMNALAKKYRISTDWGPRQWKILPKGTPIIHDYGFVTDALQIQIQNDPRFQ